MTARPLKIARQSDPCYPKCMKMHGNARFWRNAPADQHTRRKRSLVMAKAAPTSEKSEKAETVRPVKKEVPQPAQPPRDPARDSALTRAVQQIEKQFGKAAVMPPA